MRLEAVDPAVLERCRKGDMTAFEQLCAQVHDDLYGFVYSLLRNHDDTDEALQETLVRIYRHLPKLQDLGKFRQWAMRIAVNQCHSARARRTEKMLCPLEEEAEVANERVVGGAARGLSPRESMEQKEMMSEVETAIGALPPRQREAIVLFEVENHSIKEIAQLLGCSEGAVKFHIHEARKKLRHQLSHYLTQHARPRE